MTKIDFLGTGTSTGVPELGCKCEVCLSTNPLDQRLRTSVLIHHKNKHILIDCGPDFRQQMMRSKNENIDAVLITHEHYDHVGGLDDLRPFSRQKTLPIFLEPSVAQKLRERMPYCLRAKAYPGVPNIELNELDIHRSFDFEGVEIIPIRVNHGRLPILGYRIGNMAFLTDLTDIPAQEYEKLRNLDILIIAALRKHQHVAHQTFEEAISKIDCIQSKRSYLIHASHHLGLYDELVNELPENVFLSYDGLIVEFE
ncbi:MAG: MBL fold metallo-hydrolase [Bacteroidales bacterium]|nr:MBL fold metallo-hydrolase [Bacteroidales bacterium]